MPPKKPTKKKTGEHPVYDVPEFGSQSNLPVVPGPVPEPPEPKHRKKVRQAATWTVQVALVAIPAAISGFASYKSAQVDSEAGYKTMVQAVQELQETTKGLVTQVAYLQGEIDSQRAAQPRPKGLQPFTQERKAPPVPKAEFTALPLDLTSAVVAQKDQKQMAVDVSAKVKENENIEKREAAIEEMKKAREDKAAEKR